ncbi:hypothetical protein LHYA1_G002764 [Lachnellula hyalina]|uniref:Uncharacterized protein n=1 Tax=Lachnellula hyalina TaxID=1316788 RepID=A0A8H8R495_9HELO|nr:uncharacterized protein LHYA1_G002764 [Lachnellula hyalina]TVY28158.1 hypothetical protein LHYA1_G002764 [Lachnellula hyalina]
MSWFSILPEPFVFVETWVVRFFLFLGILSIGPWALLIIYDAILYVFRTATYEIPYIGGRARHRPRPRAPSLSERPSGYPRRFSLTLSGVPTPAEAIDTVSVLQKRKEKSGYERDGSAAE